MRTNFHPDEYFELNGEKILDASAVIRRHLDELLTIAQMVGGKLHYTDSSVDEITDLNDYYNWIMASLNTGDEFQVQDPHNYLGGPPIVSGWMLKEDEVEAIEQITGLEKAQFMEVDEDDAEGGP